MAEKDLTTKHLETIPEVFADIFNGFEFYDNDALRIDPAGLKDLPTESIYYDDEGNIRNMLQDSFKEYGGQQFALVCLGLENQTTLDRSMPVRILGYIYTGYKAQLEKYIFKKRLLREYIEKSDTDIKRNVYRNELDNLGRFTLTPTIILVLNFSGKTWDEPQSLLELTADDNPYKKYMSDFSIKVIDIHLLKDEDYEKFSSDFGPVISFLNADNVNFAGIYTDLKYPLEALSMINAYKMLDNYENIRDNIYNRTKKGEAVNMGTIVDIVRAEGRAEGREEGKAEGLTQGGNNMLYSIVQDGDLSPEKGAERLGISVEQLKRDMNNMGYTFPE